MIEKLMYICLMVFTLPIIVCSNDHSDNGLEGLLIDPIVGKWQYSSTVEYEGGEQLPLEELSDCEKRSTIEFTTEGNGSVNFCNIDEEGNCVDDPETFSWENEGNGIYIILVDDDREVELAVDVSGNTIKISETYVDDGTTFMYTDTFVKIN